MGTLTTEHSSSMHAQVLLTLLLSSASLARGQHQGRTFLFSTFPSNTFPLTNRLQAVPTLAKLRKDVLDEVNREEEEVAVTETEGTFPKDIIETDYSWDEHKVEATEKAEFSEETTSHADIKFDVTTNDIVIQEGEEFNFIDDKEEDFQAERSEKSLLNQFPFHQQGLSSPHGPHHHGPHHHTDQHSHHQDRRFEDFDKSTSILSQLSNAETDPSGRKCVNKVMMREETEYDEILTCDHSYDKRCHTSYITKYEPHQEQECDEKFRKVCTIEYEQKAVHEMVEVCITPFVKDCDIDGEEVCHTVYESECSTFQIVHQVEDDVANCKTVEERKCQDVTEGFKTVNKCDTWPVEKCTLEKKMVKKYTPQTSCQKVPKEMCSPKGCGVKEGPVQCQDKVKTVIVDSPIEQCDMEPLRTCKHVTKLVPKLEPSQECVDVPKEICARSKVNPKKVKKPSIQKWCFTPKEVKEGECKEDSDCNNAGIICKNSYCVPGCNQDEDCPSGFSCSQRKCRVAAGKVLLGSFTIKTESCTGCSENTEGVLLTLQGERTVDFESGYPCNTAPRIPLNHADVDDFKSGGVARFDGTSANEQSMMGDCFKAPLNALVRGGTLTWVGEGVWTPSSICVDWQSTNYAYKCELGKVVNTDNIWQIVACKEDYPRQKCQ